MSQNMSDPSASAIERDLDQTRSRLNTNLTMLQQRMTPGQVLDDLMRYFRGKEGADFGRSLVDSVRGNPLPAAITGIGLTWLMASNPRAGASSQTPSPAMSGTSGLRVERGWLGFNDGGHEAVTARVRTAEQLVGRKQGEEEHQYASRLDVARGQALGLARHEEETTTSFSDRVRAALTSAQETLAAKSHDLRDQATGAASTIGSALQGASHSVGEAAQRAGDAMGQGGQAAGKAGGNLLSTVTESPVLMGALSLAAGALLGALLPQLEQEEATLGKLAGQARDTAKSLAQDAVDRSGTIAQAVLDKGGDSAEAHGLTGSKGPGELLDAAMSGNLAKDVKQVAEDFIHSGNEAVRKEALGQGKEAPNAG